jgi:hypothetical protein
MGLGCGLIISQFGSETALSVMNLGEVNLGDRFSRSVRWSIVAYSVARPWALNAY